jgi:signal transduction histidine kinase
MTLTTTGGTISYNFNILGRAHLVFVTVLYLSSLAFLFREFLVTTDKLHKQARILFGGILSGVFFSFLPLLTDSLDFVIDPMVLGLLVSVGMFSYGLNKYDLSTTNPVQLSTIIDDLDTGILILNNNNEIIRANKSVLSFTSTQDILGKSIDLVFENSEFTDFIKDEKLESHITLTNPEKKQYKLLQQPIDYGRNASGKLILLRDITTVESQRQQLELLRQIFSRLLRHNIRNKLTIINGAMENLEKQLNGSADKQIGYIKRSTDSLLQSSNKAHLLSQATTERTVNQDVIDFISQGINAVQNSSEVSITTNLEDPKTSIKSAPSAHNIIKNILENSLKHNTKPVNIYISGRNTSENTYTVIINDNGSGLPQEEIDVVESNKESSLQHGTGVGLWVIKLLTEHIDGSVTFDSSESGTTVTLELRTETESQIE